MDNINPSHLRYRLSIEQAIESLTEEYNNVNEDSFKLIYLYGFDIDNKLVWGQFIRCDEPLCSLEFIIGISKDFADNLAKSDTYFMIKTKEYEFDSNDNSFRLKAYLDGHADMSGTMKMVKKFINSWKEFDTKSAEDKPYLKRYIIDFINQSLGLPFLYSYDQSKIDAAIMINESRKDTVSTPADIAKIKKYVNMINKENLLLLLNSNILWRFLFLLVSVLLLIILFNFSQNGRYIPLQDLYLLDTRTGIIYFPYGANGENKLKPAIDPDSYLPPPKP